MFGTHLSPAIFHHRAAGSELRPRDLFSPQRPDRQMGDLPPGKSPIAKTRLMDSVCPAAVPAGVPTKSWPANHADRSNNDRTRHHDHAFVSVATTIAATMFAAPTAARGLGTNACEAQQGG